MFTIINQDRDEIIEIDLGNALFHTEEVYSPINGALFGFNLCVDGIILGFF